MVPLSLGQDSSVVARTVDYHGYDKREYIALTRPNLSSFSADEIVIIDDVIEFVCCKHTARSISEWTHDEIWEIAQIGEEIPYMAVLASHQGDIDKTDIAWADAAQQKLS